LGIKLLGITSMPSDGSGGNFGAAQVPLKHLRGQVMRRTVERFFEAVEVHAGSAVFATVTSLAMTGCLRFFWE